MSEFDEYCISRIALEEQINQTPLKKFLENVMVSCKFYSF